MKKGLFIGICLIMSLFFVSCGNQKTENTDTENISVVVKNLAENIENADETDISNVLENVAEDVETVTKKIE
ncbi:MAG: hypothetical protein ACLULK_01385 [Anaerovoracaceae bacterium]